MISASTSPPRLAMKGICKRFGATRALSGVDFSVQAGEVHALVGENGAGKSTLMKIVSGAIRPDAGQMLLDGVPFQPAHPQEARQSGVAMIYQELALADHLTVEENITLGMEPSQWGILKRKEIHQMTEQALAQLEHPEIRPNSRVGSLSTAARQLVEIARALAIGCRVLVLDEPTSSLTGRDVQRLFQLIRNLKQQNLAIIYISHFIEEIKEVADCFSVLRDGQTVGHGQIADTTAEQIVHQMVGRKIENLYCRSRRTQGEKIIEIKDLSGAPKPQSVSLGLHRGEVLGIAGLIGAGRTELLRAIFGLEPVRSGQLRVAAYSGPASPTQRWAQGVGLLSEDRKDEGLATSLSILENMTLSSLHTMRSYCLVKPSTQQAATQAWIEKLGIQCQKPQQKVGELSGGNQQKVALGRLLLHDVDVLLLDEPTRGIDVASKAQIYELIDRLTTGTADQPGKAVLLVSSYLPELLGVCDRIAVMHRGKLGPARPVSDWSEHQLLLEATGTGGAA